MINPAFQPSNKEVVNYFYRQVQAVIRAKNHSPNNLTDIDLDLCYTNTLQHFKIPN